MSNNNTRKYTNNSQHRANFNMKDNWIDFTNNNNNNNNNNRMNKKYQQQSPNKNRMFNKIKYSNDDILSDEQRDSSINGLTGYVKNLTLDQSLNNSSDENCDSQKLADNGNRQENHLDEQQMTTSKESSGDLNDEHTGGVSNDNNNCSVVPNVVDSQLHHQTYYQVQYASYAQQQQQQQQQMPHHQIYEVVYNGNRHHESRNYNNGVVGDLNDQQIYSNDNSTYDAQTAAAMMPSSQQAQAPTAACYVWPATSQPYMTADYASSMAATAAVNTSASTPIQPTIQQAFGTAATSYYTTTAAATVPYMYDPAIAAASYIYPTATMQQQQQPVSNTNILSSPQQSTLFSAAYQTPPQPQHQLYMTPSSSSNGSPGDLATHQVIIPSDRLTSCESPQMMSNGLSSFSTNATTTTTATPAGGAPSANGQTTTTVIYPSSYLFSSPNPYLTSPTAYMMYSPVPQASLTPSASIGSTPQATIAYQASTPYQNLSINTNLNPTDGYNSTPNAQKCSSSLYNRYNNNNNSNNSIKTSHYNYKRNYGNRNKYQQSTSPYDFYNNNTNKNGSSYQTSTQQQFDESSTDESHLNDLNVSGMQPNYSMYPSPSSFVSSSMFSPQSAHHHQMVPQYAPSSLDFNGSSNLMMTPPATNLMGNTINLSSSVNPNLEYDPMQSYSCGDEYVDNYDDEQGENLDGDDDQQLACQVCRGRRMCFCYFLKVRYYKFPSFFDLVDHQYKKWRSSMAKSSSNAITVHTSTPAAVRKPTSAQHHHNHQ